MAVQDVKDKILSIREASRMHIIPMGTLQRHLKGAVQIPGSL